MYWVNVLNYKGYIGATISITWCNTATTRHRSLHLASGSIRLILVLLGCAERSRVQGMHPWNASVASLPVPVPLVPPLVRTLVPLTVHTLLRAFVCSTLPLFWDQLPLGYDVFSLSPALSLPLSLLPSLPLLLHRPLPSLSRTLGRVVLRVPSLSSISLLRAPTTASGEPTGERVTTFAPIARARTARHSSLIAPNVHGIPNCVRLTCATSHELYALTLVTRGEQDKTFLKILMPRRGGRPVAWSMLASTVASSRTLIIFKQWLKKTLMTWGRLNDGGKIESVQVYDISMGWFVNDKRQM